MKYLFSCIFIALTMSSCNSPRYYQPENTVGDWENQSSLKHDIVFVKQDMAFLDNSSILSRDFNKTVSIEDKEILGISDGWLISSSIDGNLSLEYLADKELKKNFTLKNTIASASIKDDTLAILFVNNTMALYSISSKELLFKEHGIPPLIINERLAKPLFLNDLVLFATLDGKIVIINKKLKKRLRTLIVSSKESFNNIIYLNIINNKIIAATSSQIISLSKQEHRAEYDIKTVNNDNDLIYLLTKQGEIVILDIDLKVKASKKIPFANLLGSIANKEKLYVLEREGYLMEFSKDLQKSRVYDVDLDDGHLFIMDKTFYIDDRAIRIQ